jgi:phage-related protein
VDKTPANLLAAVIDLIPVGGSFISSVLDYFKATTPVADWLFGAVGDFVSMIEGIGSQFEAIWNGITIDSVADPEKIINQIADLFRNTVTSVFNFAVECGSTFLTMVKDIAITNVVDFVQNYFPDAFDMLCVVLGENPISKEKVDRNGTNIMNAGLKVLGEEGAQIKEQMLANGIFEKCVAWIDRAIGDITKSVEEIKEAFTTLWSTITFESLFHPIDTFNLIVEKFTSPVTRIANFLKDAVLELLKILKDALLVQLSAYAKGTKGYFLITVLIQKDIFTGEHVDFNVENLIHGFMKLMDGGEEQFQQMKESGAIAKASQKITAAVKKLNFTWEYIKGLFTSLWESMLWTDFLNIFGVFAKIVKTFGDPILRLIAFIIEIIKIVVEVLLIIMNFPFNLINNIISKAMMAFELIKKDPIGFLKNLLRAIKEGFMQFFENILTHLFNGLKEWFLGEVRDAGIPIPTDFTPMGVIKWLLAVLDITMEKIWKKLEEKIGKPKVDKIKKMIDTAERVAGAVGEAYEFMKDVQERGFMAVMIDKVKEQLSNVWELVLDAVKSFVMDQIIKKVTVKLLSMLDPTGIMAVINSAIALYKAIQTFIKYLREMLEIVNSFVEGTLQIAQGATKKAADFLEGALASGIPIVIGFLANQVGLNLSERLKDALELVREKVDKGLTWVIDKVVGIIEKVVSFGKAVVASVVDWWKNKKQISDEGETHTIYFSGNGSAAQLMIASVATKYEDYIDQLKIADTDPKKAEKESAKVNAKAKHKELNDFKNSIESKSPADPADAQKISDLMDNIASETKTIIFPRTAMPKSTPPVYGGLTGGFGTKMQVSILTKNVPEGGSSANSGLFNTNYSILDSRYEKKGSVKPFYLRGHLLNADLGGPGDNWNNLVPLTAQANKNHSLQIENPVKAKLNKKKDNKYPILKYTVDAIYTGWPDKDSMLAALNNPTLWDGSDIATKKIGAIINAEESVPNKLICEVKEIDDNGVETDFIAKKEIANDIRRDNDLNKYYV